MLIVGARDESSMPKYWWQHVFHSFQLCEHMSIEMIGPDLSSKWDKHVVNYATRDDEDKVNKVFTLKLLSPVENKVLLHEHPNFQEKLLNADVVVMFNPVSSSISLLGSLKSLICTFDFVLGIQCK